MKKQFIIILVTISFIACTNEVDTMLIGGQGVELFDNGDYEGALEKFNEIIRIDSLDAGAHSWKADCLDLMGHPYQAIESYSTSIYIDSLSKPSFYNRALTYEKIKDWDNAVADYKSALNLDFKNETEPYNQNLLNNLGILYGQLDMFDDAIESFTKAIEIDNKFADAYGNIGYVYQLKGEHNSAIENFNLAIQLNPNEQSYKDLKFNSEDALK